MPLSLPHCRALHIFLSRGTNASKEFLPGLCHTVAQGAPSPKSVDHLSRFHPPHCLFLKSALTVAPLASTALCCQHCGLCRLIASSNERDGAALCCSVPHPSRPEPYHSLFSTFSTRSNLVVPTRICRSPPSSHPLPCVLCRHSSTCELVWLGGEAGLACCSPLLGFFPASPLPVLRAVTAADSRCP